MGCDGGIWQDEDLKLLENIEKSNNQKKNRKIQTIKIKRKLLEECTL